MQIKKLFISILLTSMLLTSCGSQSSSEAEPSSSPAASSAEISSLTSSSSLVSSEALSSEVISSEFFSSEIIVSSLIPSSEGPIHVHVFDQEVVEHEYLACEATCLLPATYYYSCECGEKGTETFTYGVPTEHELEIYSLIVEGHEDIHNCVEFVCKNCDEHFYEEATFLNTNMPIMEIKGDLSKVTKDKKSKLSLTYNGEDISLDCDTTVKVQGASSAELPKKNFSLQFFKKDTNYDKKEKVELFKGCGKQSKYCLKADYVDTTHARNLIGANIARDVVKDRGDIDQLYNLANAGLTDGFPVLLYNDNAFYGLYSLVIPKDKWLYNMDDDEVIKSAILNTNNRESSGFSVTTNYEFTNGFDLEFCSTEGTSGTDWVADSLNELIDFVVNNDGVDFVNGLSNYLSVERIIDVILCTEVFGGWDNILNNVMMVTYDGKTWIPSMYDMDTCFGWNKPYNYNSSHAPCW